MTYNQMQLKEYISGAPDKNTFHSIKLSIPSLKEGEILLRPTHWSVDPYMRARMSANANSFGLYKLNAPILTMAVAVVEKSKNEKIKVGETYTSWFSLSELVVVGPKAIRGLIKTNPKIPQSNYLSVLGLTGGTAYQGNNHVLEVKKGDQYFVNAAAGAVGSIAGMMAKILGAYVVGSAGGEEKCRLLTEKYGFDACINYRDYPDKTKFMKILKEKFPKGIDKYFDNVGGYQTDAVVPLLNLNARIAVCGQISQYNKITPDKHDFMLFNLIYRRIRVEGFIFDLTISQKLEFMATMEKWISAEKLVVSETIFHGLDKTAEAFLSLFTGKKKGKVIIAAK